MIHSKEEITQGDCLAMSLYEVALMSLASKMCNAIHEALQPWYCDDAGVAGKAVPNVQCLDFLVKFGPTYGYFPEPSKLYYICRAEDEEVAHAAFEGFGLEINYSRGKQYLGGFIGSAKIKEKWWQTWWSSGWAWWKPSALLLRGILRLHTLASPSVCRMSGNMSSELSPTLPHSSCPLRRQSARASCRLSLVSHHQLRLMVNTARFSPTASGWVGWQSATLWTLLRVYTEPRLRLHAT